MSQRRTWKWILLVVMLVPIVPISYFALRRTPPLASITRSAAESPQAGASRPVPSLSVTTTVFSLFGPAKTYMGGSGWSVGIHAHAEWFVPTASGRLSTIEVAIEPSYVRAGREMTARNAEAFLAEDKDGFPGKILESFSLFADSPKVPAPTNALVLESVEQPVLQAGTKYWLFARCPGPGSWVWRFNDQNKMEISAREAEPEKWASAGNGRNGAFSVTVTSTE
jgi:hypothetical protein